MFFKDVPAVTMTLWVTSAVGWYVDSIKIKFAWLFAHYTGETFTYNPNLFFNLQEASKYVGAIWITLWVMLIFHIRANYFNPYIEKVGSSMKLFGDPLKEISELHYHPSKDFFRELQKSWSPKRFIAEQMIQDCMRAMDRFRKGEILHGGNREKPVQALEFHSPLLSEDRAKYLEEMVKEVGLEIEKKLEPLLAIKEYPATWTSSNQSFPFESSINWLLSLLGIKKQIPKTHDFIMNGQKGKPFLWISSRTFLVKYMAFLSAPFLSLSKKIQSIWHQIAPSYIPVPHTYFSQHPYYKVTITRKEGE